MRISDWSSDVCSSDLGGRQKQLTSLAPSSALRAPSPANGRRAAAHLAAPCDSPSPAQREKVARSAGSGRERSEQAVALDCRLHRNAVATLAARNPNPIPPPRPLPPTASPAALRALAPVRDD